MKIVVVFGRTRIVVPIDDDCTVQQLQMAASNRYARVLDCKLRDDVFIHRLVNSDGAILDAHDRLRDVVDDRDQVVAIYDSNSEPKQGSEGVSDEISSTSSPDYPPHQSSIEHYYSKMNGRLVIPTCNSSVVEINDLTPGSNLLVRSNDSEADHTSQRSKSIDSETHQQRRRSKPPAPSPPPVPKHQSVDRFTHSIQSASTSSEALDSLSPMVVISIPKSKSQPLSSTRRDQMSTPPQKSAFAPSATRKSRLTNSMWDRLDELDKRLEEQHEHFELDAAPKTSTPKSSVEHNQHNEPIEIKLKGGAMALGIQVEPTFMDNSDRLKSLVVTQIDNSGRVAFDGRISIGDEITSIRSRPVYQMSIQRARQYLDEMATIEDAELSVVGGNLLTQGPSTVNTSTGRLMSALQKANTRRVGHEMTIPLKKGQQGLGFTVTSRDVDTSQGERSFFIKTIMPNGAADVDGQLRRGHRLLKVNDQSLGSLTQTAIVQLLRNIPIGETVHLTIASSNSEKQCTRSTSSIAQDTASGNYASRPINVISPLPRPLTSHGTIGEMKHQKQFLAFDVPLHDTGSAGLGISVKGRRALAVDNNGKSCTEKYVDCGIYIKTIMHGGAAHKDARLLANDQLITVNDTDLRGKTNEEAMQLIAETTKAIGRNAPSIHLGVLRIYKDDPVPPTTSTNDPSFHIDDESTRKGDDDIGRKYQVSGNGDYTMINKTTPVKQSEHDKVDLYEDLETRSVASTHSSRIDPGVQFQRDAPTRQSLSEKRHGKEGKTDPSHLEAFQRIKHHRQTSAPTTRDGRVTLSSSPKRASVKLSQNKRHTVFDAKIRDLSPTDEQRRRSMSLESSAVIASKQQPTLIHEMTNVTRHEKKKTNTLFSKLGLRFGSGRSNIPSPDSQNLPALSTSMDAPQRDKHIITTQHEKIIRQQPHHNRARSVPKQPFILYTPGPHHMPRQPPPYALYAAQRQKQYQQHMYVPPRVEPLSPPQWLMLGGHRMPPPMNTLLRSECALSPCLVLDSAYAHLACTQEPMLYRQRRQRAVPSTTPNGIKKQCSDVLLPVRPTLPSTSQPCNNDTSTRSRTTPSAMHVQHQGPPGTAMSPSSNINRYFSTSTERYILTDPHHPHLDQFPGYRGTSYWPVSMRTCDRSIKTHIFYE